ncbi:MAG: SDR family NAD(P)-dependent oxidoreductase [Bacteroidales bacterium]|nr:SDR family NAD(P)-dependent oxidoreductase [Bacteroidales bacterium]
MQKKNILITGVSSGIGYSIAETMIQNGYFVFGTVRKVEDAESLKMKLGNGFYPLIVDITDYKSIECAVEVVKDVISENGLTALINNSGIVVSGPLKHINSNDFEYQFRVNVFGLLKMTQALLPLLGGDLSTNIKAGKIININSVSGLLTLPFIVPYSASKYAVESLTDGLRRELAIYGISVTSIHPGAVKTPIWQKEKDKINSFHDTDYEMFEAYSKHQIALAEKDGIDALVIAKTVNDIVEGRKRKPGYILMKHDFAFRIMLMLPKTLQDNIVMKMMYAKTKISLSDELKRGWFIVSNIIPPIGFYLYFRHRKQYPNKAQSALKGAIIGIPVGIVMKYIFDNFIFS